MSLPVEAATWRNLVDCGNPWVPAGALLRCKGQYPYESIVDFLVFDAIALADAGFGLLVASGYKAGLVRQILPLESRGPELAHGLQTRWLVENWAVWGYPECPVDQVMIRESLHHPAAV